MRLSYVLKAVEFDHMRRFEIPQHDNIKCTFTDDFLIRFWYKPCNAKRLVNQILDDLMKSKNKKIIKNSIRIIRIQVQNAA